MVVLAIQVTVLVQYAGIDVRMQIRLGWPEIWS